jgi:hypothetical protein
MPYLPEASSFSVNNGWKQRGRSPRLFKSSLRYSRWQLGEAGAYKLGAATSSLKKFLQSRARPMDALPFY